ncbi:bifunctional 5,10-methylenetetrahydrofolate dehydrogenase/5,10-methenyltetrahydrofolate cyclohydrolase [Candidatus Kaiserbacteria bacterium]|nr:bifunctional 5,10-methylenetetrahydrofolate dehydrogenase/5,10-methenyltetrahydrofolate cyclohydrolase [Candidatus Kaiserbacteria bacterium]
MIVDGKAIAEKLYGELAKEREAFGDLILGHLLTEVSTVTASYARIKERGAARLGIKMFRTELPPGSTTADALDAIKHLVETTDGVIPQLPIVKGIDIESVLNAIPKEKDVDVLSAAAIAEFEKGGWPAIPPVPAALAYILKESDIDVRGKNLVMLGKGRLVGKPGSILFTRLGANVTCLVKGDEVESSTRAADIIVLGTGVAGILKPDMVKDGVAVVDAGTSEQGGKVVGDADPAVAEKASVFTPVPGGVGPVAIAMIYKNLFALKKTFRT